jgi:hypothetical protein
MVGVHELTRQTELEICIDAAEGKDQLCGLKTDLRQMIAAGDTVDFTSDKAGFL